MGPRKIPSIDTETQQLESGQRLAHVLSTEWTSSDDNEERDGAPKHKQSHKSLLAKEEQLCIGTGRGRKDNMSSVHSFGDKRQHDSNPQIDVIKAVKSKEHQSKETKPAKVSKDPLPKSPSSQPKRNTIKGRDRQNLREFKELTKSVKMSNFQSENVDLFLENPFYSPILSSDCRSTTAKNPFYRSSPCTMSSGEGNFKTDKKTPGKSLIVQNPIISVAEEKTSILQFLDKEHEKILINEGKLKRGKK